MRATVLIGVILYCFTGYGQFKEIPVSKVTNFENRANICVDSSNLLSKFCSTSLDGFFVSFYYVYFNDSSKVLGLIGRVCVSREKNSPGIPEVEIFSAIKVNNKLYKRHLIGKTTYDKNAMNNDGFFHVELMVERKESLFFYGTGYFVKEFFISNLCW